MLEATSEVYTNNPSFNEQLMWIIPKLMTELDNSSDQSQVQLLASAITSILENFVDLDKVQGSDYLKRIKSDIEETAVKLFDYLIKKAQDFPIFSSTLTVLFSLGNDTSRKFMEKILDLLNQSFEKVSDNNIKELL